MKKVLLIGASGHTSREIIPRLIKQDDVILTLFSRKTVRLNNYNNERIRIIDGDATILDDLNQAIRDQDIVISTMGGMDLGEKTKLVVEVMEALGVSRFIAISAGGIYDELPAEFNAWDKSMVGYLRPSNLKTANVIENSTLKYTILRPVWLTDENSESFILTEKGDLYIGTETSRASIGRFVADLVKEPALYTNHNLGISKPNTHGSKPVAY